MALTLPIDTIMILNALSTAGYSAYIVGGAVRDLLMGKDQEPTDWDFTTNATPEQIQKLFPESFYENQFGTVAITREHVREQFGLPVELHQAEQDRSTAAQKVINLEEATKIHESLSSSQPPTTNHQPPTTKSVFEITTFRSEGLYSDFRRPDAVNWGTTIEEDLQRRDFTINAMAISLQTTNHQPPTTNQYHIIDPHHGQEDLKLRLIRTVGDPHTRFQEDALRMLRAIRFSVQLGFDIETKTFNAISDHAELIKHVSWERIRDEFMKMIASPNPRRAIDLLDQTKLLTHILPELIAAKGVQQGGHHISDVWTHSLDALQSCPSTDPVVRFATLLHDIAKPQTYRNVSGKITFYNHEIVGARVARNIAHRFRLSNEDIQRIFVLVRHHMFYYQPHNTDAAIRRFMRKVGLENINDIIDLRIGDRLGSGSKETSWRFEEMKRRMQEQLHQPFSVHDLAIDGHDLMTALNLTPGPLLGKILNTLFEEVLEHPELNTKEELLAKAKALVQTL